MKTGNKDSPVSGANSGQSVSFESSTLAQGAKKNKGLKIDTSKGINMSDDEVGHMSRTTTAQMGRLVNYLILFNYLLVSIKFVDDFTFLTLCLFILTSI